MIVGGVHILIGEGWNNQANDLLVGQSAEAALILALPAPSTPAWESKLEILAGEQARQTDYTQRESFVALPGSPYLGYTGRPFGGQPRGFGSAGIGVLGFGLSILTSPAMYELLSGISFVEGETGPDDLPLAF